MDTIDSGRVGSASSTLPPQSSQQQRITLGNLQFQQDPNDPQKWIITNEAPNQSTAPSTSTGMPPPSRHIDNTARGSGADSPMSDPNFEAMGMGDVRGEYRPHTPLQQPKRCACTCPNCQNNSVRSGDGKTRLHICHICSKTYGKTSHLR